MIIYEALNFLKTKLDEYLVFKLGDEHSDKISVSNIINQDGTAASNTANKILFTLVNVEEERIGKVQTPQRKTINGMEVWVAPEINVNLYLLITANLGNYDESLKFLSHVLTFFQSQNLFDSTNSPTLDTTIQKLILELSSISFEQLNNLWGAMGAKYMPSALYKVRMLTIQANRVQKGADEISGIEAKV